MESKKDVIYVVASKLGTIGMGSTAYYAIRGIENSGLDYFVFCRGYNRDILLNKGNLSHYSWLEYLSYPFRFVEKYFGIKMNSFGLVNFLLSKLILLTIPKSKIYHTWMDIAPEAVKKAKKRGAILILEGANSHPLNSASIINGEYKKLGMKEYLIDIKKIKEKNDYLSLFDYIFCPSKFVYDSFLKFGFKKEQLFLIPYGVDIRMFADRKEKKDSKFRAIFVGSIQLRKGIQYLLEAWADLKLKNAELIIIGRVWPDARKIVSEYKGNPSIKFIGFNSSPQKYLKESDIFISPSLEEGSALTCYEAMASGLPIIATYNTGSIARDKKDGFVIPIRDTSILKEKIKYFYNNPKKVIEMGKNAKDYVQNFTWEDYGKRLVKSYNIILSRPHPKLNKR